MTVYQRISVTEAHELLTSGAAVADIRDADSYAAGHLPEARHLTNENLQEFIESSDLDTPLVVCCYHGNSSQMAAQFLIERGFENVYSLDGGYEAWERIYPGECERSP